MEKKKNLNTKEVVQKVQRAYKKNPKMTILLIIILVILTGGFGFLYGNGYLDDFFPEDNNPPVTGPHEQDENGFYYYRLTGYEVGDYYYRAKDLSGQALADQLHIIINENFNKISYGDARYVLAYSDRDPKNNNESVRGIYDNDVIATYWIGMGEGEWQREHVWPNSKLGIPRVDNSSKNQGSDIHNLRAITGINQTRSNRYYEDGSGEAKTVGTNGFYPGDEHKGDVARILFYMAIKYDFLTLTNDVSKLGEDNSTNYTLEGAFAGKLDLLIQWHKEDPVDEFEIQRNEFIYSGVATKPDGKTIAPQGNRNPFIDKPEYVHLIWEEKEIADLLKPETGGTILSFRIIYYFKPFKENEWVA